MAGYTKTRPPYLKFHAVTVHAGRDACPQALALKDVRMLSADAPRLPMQDCAQPDLCDCRFHHHDDRRAGPRRRTDGARPMTEGSLATAERRRVRGRRETDFA